MSYRYRRRNPKVIALIIEIVLLIIGFMIYTILDNSGIKLNPYIMVIFFVVLIISLLLTLSLIRYDAFRDIRADHTFKDTNLPIYTDQTALLGHDIKEEKEEKK